MQCSSHTGRQWLSPTTTLPHPTSTPRYLTTTHSTSIYTDLRSLFSYARVTIVYLAIFFLRPSLVPRLSLRFSFGRVKGHTWNYCAEGGRAWERGYLRPMGHGSSHARSRSTQLRAMIESSENVHYIEPSNL